MAMLRWASVCLWLVVSLSVLTVAQSTTSLRGTVTDPKGALLPGTDVTLADPQTGFTRTVQSGSDGVYQFLQVPPSLYVLTASAAGFSTFKEANLRLLVNTPATVNIDATDPGNKCRSAGHGRGATGKHAGRASLGNEFTERQLLRLPSEGRDPASILSLQPGVTYIGTANTNRPKQR